MLPGQNSDHMKPATDFFLEDFRHFTSSFWENERGGEIRVNWSLVLVAGVAARAGTLVAQGDLTKRFVAVALAVLSGLLIIGVVTTARIRKLNRTADWDRKRLNLLRQQFASAPGEHDDWPPDQVPAREKAPRLIGIADDCAQSAHRSGDHRHCPDRACHGLVQSARNISGGTDLLLPKGQVEADRDGGDANCKKQGAREPLQATQHETPIIAVAL
jgi:hypothetical protein